MSVVKVISVLFFIVGVLFITIPVFAKEGGTISIQIMEAASKNKLPDAIVRVSYLDKNLKAQNIDIDPTTLAASLKDAAAGKSEMKDDEIQKAMMKLQEVAQKKSQEAAETNKKAAADFLEKNKTKEGVKSTASGLQYIVEKEGDGKMPVKEDVVKCHYVGTLTTGEKFDSSVDRGQPAEFPLAGVIPGWTEALQLMKVGSKYKLFIPPELAYGAQGRPGIPANSVLQFEVELLDIVKKDAKAPEAAKPPKKK